MQLASADHAVRVHAELREALSAPERGTHVRSEGLRFARACPQGCRVGRPVMNTRGAWTCPRCRAPWPFERALLLRGEVQEQRSAEWRADALAKLADLEVALSRLSRFHRCALESYVLLGSHRAARESMARDHPRWRPKLTEWKMKQAVRVARAELKVQLRKAGLLRDG